MVVREEESTIDTKQRGGRREEGDPREDRDMYFQKRRARAHPRLKSFVCIRCLSSGIFTVWSYYFIRLNLNTRKILLLPAPIPWPQATIIELDQLRRSKLPFLSSEYNLVEKTAWPTPALPSSRIFLCCNRGDSRCNKKERERRRKNNKGNTFLSNFSFLELSRGEKRNYRYSETENRARKSELSRGKVNRFVNHVTGTAGVSQAKHWHVQSFRSLHLPYRLGEPTAVRATRVQRERGRRRDRKERERERERERTPSGLEKGSSHQGVEIEMKTEESIPLVNEGY